MSQLTFTDQERQEFTKQLEQFGRNLDRDISHRLARRCHFVVADKYGREIGKLPRIEFEGLDKLINTGYQK